MAKYNILDEDDIFSESGGEEESGKKEKKKEEPEEPEINIDGEELFDDSLLVDKEEEAESQDPPGDFFDKKEEEDIELDLGEDTGRPDHDEKLKDFFRDEEQDERYEAPEPEAPAREEQEESQVHHIIEEYEDERIQGLNYKPFLIGGVVIVLLIAVYFAFDRWILGGGDDQVSQETAEEAVPQEPQLTPEQIRKNQQLATLAGRTNRQLSFITNVIGIAGNQGGNLSSLLLYDKSFILEIFGDDRAELARTQKALQAGIPGMRFDIVAAETRPGEEGGILGVYSLELNGEPPSQDVAQKFASVQEAKNWINTLSNTNGLKINRLQETSTRTVDNFRVAEIETILSGSLEECRTALRILAESGTNLKIHKLNMTTTDQSSFSPSNIRVQLILQLYV